MTLIDTLVLIDILKGELNVIGDSICIITLMEIIRTLDKNKRLKVLEQLKKKTYTIYPNVALEYSEL